MAITFPITGVISGYGSSRSPSFTLGTAPAEHDILVAYLSTSINTGAITDPGGWVNVLGTDGREMPADSSSVGVMLYHRVTAAEVAASTVTWTFTNLWATASRGVTTVAVLRGVALSGELVGAASASDISEVTPWVIPSVTPTADDCQVVAGLSADYLLATAPNTQTAPSGWTLRAGGADTQSNYLYSRDTLGSDGVATGAENVTPSAADEYVSIIACFAEATATTTYGTASGTISVIGSAVGSNLTTKLFHGSTPVDAVYVGDTLVDRVYYGDTLVLG